MVITIFIRSALHCTSSVLNPSSSYVTSNNFLGLIHATLLACTELQIHTHSGISEHMKRRRLSRRNTVSIEIPDPTVDACMNIT